MTERIVAADPAAYRAVRAVNLALLRGIPEADWEKVGIHQERGRTSFRLLWERWPATTWLTCNSSGGR